MPLLKDRLDNLSGEPPAAVAELLLAALTHARADEREPIAHALLTTNQPAAFAAVIRLLDRLPHLAGDLFAADRRVLRAAIGRINAAGHPRGIARAIELIDGSRDLTLAAELLGPLNSNRPELRNAAAAAMLNTTLAVAGPTGRRHVSADRLRALDDLIAAALRQYEQHRRLDILLAASIVHRRNMPNVQILLDAPGTTTRLAVQGVPRQVREPLVRRNLFHWLDSDLLGPQVGRWMHDCTGAASLTDLLQSAHLLLAPQRRRLMRRVDRPMRCLPQLSAAVQMPARAQNHLPSYIAALPITTDRKATVLADLIALPSATARWRAAEQLLGHRSDHATDAVRRFVRDRHPAVAALPAAHLLNVVHSLDDNAIRELRHSAHRPAAARAAIEWASRSPSHWSAAIEELPHAAVIAVAHKLNAAQPQGFTAQLRSMMTTADRDARLRGIALARRLGRVCELEPVLRELAAAEDPQISSAAVSALAVAPSDESIEVLHRMLRHQHPRVRANAIDALSQASRLIEPKPAGALVEVLTPHALSRHNRERANVIAAWLGEDAASATKRLRDMLRDPNPMHRISAIWVAGRSRRPELAGDLGTVIRGDEQPAIRTRATAALRRLGTP